MFSQPPPPLRSATLFSLLGFVFNQLARLRKPLLPPRPTSSPLLCLKCGSGSAGGSGLPPPRRLGGSPWARGPGAQQGRVGVSGWQRRGEPEPSTELFAGSRTPRGQGEARVGSTPGATPGLPTASASSRFRRVFGEGKTRAMPCSELTAAVRAGAGGCSIPAVVPAPGTRHPLLQLPSSRCLSPLSGGRGARGQLGAPPARCCRGLEALGSGAGETLPRRAASQGAAGSGDWRGPSSPQLVGSSPLPKSCSGRIVHAAGSCSCPAGGLCSAPPKLPLPWDLGSQQCHGDHGTHGTPGARVASPPLSCCRGSGRWGGRGGAQKGSAVTTAPDLSPAVCSGAGRAFARFPGELRVYGFPVAPFPVIGSASLIPLIDAGGRGIQPPGHPLGGFGGVAPSGGV